MSYFTAKVVEILFKNLWILFSLFCPVYYQFIMLIIFNKNKIILFQVTCSLFIFNLLEVLQIKHKQERDTFF